MVNGNNGNNGNNGRGNGGGNAHGNENRLMGRLVEQFMKLKPSKFDGKRDPEVAPRWIEELEKAFEVLGCIEAEKYFSEAAQEQKLVEFRNLHQNRMTIDQYEAEFSRLSKYAPRMVENPVDRARRFRDGLRSDLRSQLVLLNLKDYDELYERGQLVERDMRERGITFGPRFTPARDNRHFGKRHVIDNRRFVPSVKKNIGKPTYQANWTCSALWTEAWEWALPKQDGSML
ncbi:uncharacterized protein LOC125313644 [Rhodamnia argentea]|uniref:Uncharacterized protein LOC125313644 n=1 Tax=Rhodamnia argentea TaxID=178133 RepID=A0ABM3GYG6_9MYRT|nr:uncharacterized protein LOC125313644 [Rhodamnia argentea]